MSFFYSEPIQNLGPFYSGPFWQKGGNLLKHLLPLKILNEFTTYSMVDKVFLRHNDLFYESLVSP